MKIHLQKNNHFLFFFFINSFWFMKIITTGGMRKSQLIKKDNTTDIRANTDSKTTLKFMLVKKVNVFI